MRLSCLLFFFILVGYGTSQNGEIPGDATTPVVYDRIQLQGDYQLVFETNEGSSCLLKGITLLVKEKVNNKEKEYTDFYQTEAYRKYLEHDFDYSVLSYLTNGSKSCPEHLKLKNRGAYTENKERLVFTRFWFQDYVCLINQQIPSVNLTDGSDLIGYPSLLLNTVREEHSKTAAYKFFDEQVWFEQKQYREFWPLVRRQADI